MRLGVIGGTFDPIHVGHIAAAHAAMECAHLDHVLFVPSATPPHRGPAEAGAKERFEMTARAIASEPRFEVSDLEIERGGRSYTVDTIRALQRAQPGDQLFLILGWDAARLFGTWREPNAILELASVVVVGRPGTSAPDAAQLRAAGLDPARTVLCLGNTPDISASELREALAKGAPVGEWLPDPVRRYIAANHLYRDNHQVGR